MISLQIKNLGVLERFNAKLDKIHASNIKDGISGELAKVGAGYAQQLYTGSATATYETSGNGEANIIAKGHGILYREYGTGYIGEGTYEGNLPTRQFEFQSRGESQTTKGWEYHYWDNQHPQEALGGWYFGKNFTRGQKAEAQMWKTYIYLRDNKAQIVGDFLRAVNK